MKEKDITPKVLQWFARNFSESVAIEIKLCKALYMPFSAVKVHQVRGLQLAENKLVHKIADGPQGGQKPFDAFMLVDTLGVLAIVWYSPRKLKRMTLLYVNDFVDYKKTCPRKSLTLPKAEEIAFKTVEL